MGAAILVDPASIVATSVSLAGPQATIPLPIANNPSLGGVEIPAGREALSLLELETTVDP